IDWYASSMWRAMPCPTGAIDRDCAARLGRAIATHEVEPQVAYHLRNAEQIEALDHRLEQIGVVLFAATVLVTIATIVGLGFGSNFVNTYGSWFTLISAGFPALGTAVFGIRFQEDFGGGELQRVAMERGCKANRSRGEADRQSPTLPADRHPSAVAIALWREPFRAVAHVFAFPFCPISFPRIKDVTAAAAEIPDTTTAKM